MSDAFLVVLVGWQHMGIADIDMVFLLVGIRVVFLLNEYSCVFLRSRLHWQHKGIFDIYMVSLLTPE